MGPHEKQTDVISVEQASYTLYDMWDMLLEEREGLLVIERLGDLTREPTNKKLHPPPLCMSPCILNDLNH